MFLEKPSRSPFSSAKRRRYVPFTSKPADLVSRYEIALAEWHIKILLSDKLKFYFRLSIGPQTRYKLLYKRKALWSLSSRSPTFPQVYLMILSKSNLDLFQADRHVPNVNCCFRNLISDDNPARINRQCYNGFNCYPRYIHGNILKNCFLYIYLLTLINIFYIDFIISPENS